MKVLHISAECYPAAKAGGLGDVAGALPKYLNKAGLDTAVILPKYSTKWILAQSFKTLYTSHLATAAGEVPFSVQQFNNSQLGFELYLVDIPGQFDRAGIYLDEKGNAWEDETERAINFQEAVLQWVLQLSTKPEILHCHDHHTGFIPFLINHSLPYRELKGTPTVFTIHNGEYHGAFGWEKSYYLPPFESSAKGLLDWSGGINPLATGIKCCWKLTTVSPGYMDELRQDSNGLEWLFNNEIAKSKGILNGIDTQVWNPATDPLISNHLKTSISRYKSANKKEVLQHFNVDSKLPMITFIGRLVTEKGADILPDLISRFLQSGGKAAFVLLGTGDPRLHEVFKEMKERHHPFFDARLEYNEKLAHQLYAGSDFLLMPSRVEPCGLNQLYALRYGTIPIVRSVGGLKDTIKNLDKKGNGSGIRFDHFSVSSTFTAITKAVEFYNNKKQFNAIRENIMNLDFSWEKSASAYAEIYNEL